METNKSVTIPVETVGQAYLEVLRARGIKYFFGNSGTDFGRLVAEWRRVEEMVELW
jgi:thiamine pyrophosphate-dependent acetolactate synthase large subunit-like protein